jgi:hypothetical protein
MNAEYGFIRLSLAMEISMELTSFCSGAVGKAATTYVVDQALSKCMTKDHMHRNENMRQMEKPVELHPSSCGKSADLYRIHQ